MVTQKPKIQRVVSQNALIVFQLIIGLAVLFFIIQRLSDIGFSKVVNTLPSSFLFYSLILILYLLQPFGESIIFSKVWRMRPLALLGIMVRKRVLNYAFVSYSGEGLLLSWAHKVLNLPAKRIASNIKDNLILSALVSNCATVVLVLLFLATGQMQRFFNVSPDLELYSILACALAFGLAVTVFKFRRKLLGVSGVIVRYIIAVHSARFALCVGLQAVIWAVALPAIPLQNWFVLATLQLVLTRVPFLPNQDLLFLALVMSMVELVGPKQEMVASTFLAIAATTQILHAISYAASFLLKQPQPRY